MAEERQMLREALDKGVGGRLGTYLRLSGPGWLQSALTLGGGSLAASLYMGVLGGYEMMWVQPLAMILGIIMLGCIGYVTLSTGKRPFAAINSHINPVLGWGWVLAVAAANIVWALPQYSLAFGVTSRNLLPGVFGDGGTLAQAAPDAGWLAGDGLAKLVFVLCVFAIAIFVTWSYDRGGLGIKIYETILKLTVAVIVACFVGVVVMITMRGSLDWGQILAGFVPNFALFERPVSGYDELLAALGPVGDPIREYWTNYIVSGQRDVMIAAAATAVGINMTFLFAYSMLQRGWTKEYRGLAMFDLSTGMFIPFLIATSCVVLASAVQFHLKAGDAHLVQGLEASGGSAADPAYQARVASITASVDKAVAARQAALPETGEASEAERLIASTLLTRNEADLAVSLEPLVGKVAANYLFGFGVVAMTLSTISLLMLVSGMVVCEMLGLPPGGWPHRFGTLLAGIGGMFGPFIWKGEAQAYLAIPTSVVGFMLLPLAYVAFWMLLNSESFMGAERPSGAKGLLGNVLVGIAATTATIGSAYMVWNKLGMIGIGVWLGFVLLALIVQFTRKSSPESSIPATEV